MTQFAWIASLFASTALAASEHQEPLRARCSPSLPFPAFDNFKILTTEASTGFLAPNHTFCNYTATITHPGADDVVYIGIWLPLDNWNGRFVANGGGGLTADNGIGELNLLKPFQQGYASAYTDGGLTLNHTIDASTGAWGLKANGQPNTPLLENMVLRAPHDMAVLGKAVTRAFYGRGPAYSYFSGCSTGGRQGYLSAEKYPTDFDGVMANAPALNSDKVGPITSWPYVVLENEAPTPKCVLGAVAKAIISACDPLDGVRDGIVLEPWNCHYDIARVVGSVVSCDEPEGNITITAGHVAAALRIFQGPTDTEGGSLWYGLEPGTEPMITTDIGVVDGEVQIAWTPYLQAWFKYFVARDPTFDASTVTYADYEALFHRSVELYHDDLGDENPDLSSFRRNGGKLLTWHGLGDPIINYQGTLEYRGKILEQVGGDDEDVNDFYRLFLAPGASHCTGGVGPEPVDALAALVEWVERGKAPEALHAANEGYEWDLCPYPQVVRNDDAGNYVCGPSPGE